MSTRKRKRPSAPAVDPAPSAEKQPTITTLSLRLPGNIRDIAQTCAKSTGVSLNGLICTALADYLVSRGYKVHS